MKEENIPQKQVLLKPEPAKMISLASTTNGLVQHFGQSWLPSVENEFEEDYFQEVVSKQVVLISSHSYRAVQISFNNFL